jgi:hypothetical protein
MDAVHEQAAGDDSFDAANQRYRINRLRVVAFLTAASGMPESKVTNLPWC